MTLLRYVRKNGDFSNVKYCADVQNEQVRGMSRGKAAFHLSRLIWWKPVKFSTFRPYFASPGVTWGPTWSTKGLAKSRSRGSKGKTKPSISPSKPHLAWILIFWWNTGCYSVTSWGFAESPVGVSYLALTMTSLRSGRLTNAYGYWLREVCK